MTADEQNIAREIVDQWFWQPAEGHNYHYRGALRTLVRFFESAPMEPDVVRLVIEYLRDEEVDGGISLMNKSVDLGTGWKAMDAWYRTDETEKWNGTDSRKVRVYQVLVQRPDPGDAVAGPFQTENGCQYAVSHEFHWNVESLPTVPASSSGVNYTLEGVVRDQETGLYSCVVVRRERVRQDVESYTSAKTLFQDTKEEQHLGVKEGESAGKSASVSSGTVVERSVTKNPDCTFDVRNVTRTDNPVLNAVVTKDETLFESRTTTEDRNQPGSAKMTLKPGESARDERTQSNLHNHTVTKVEEKPVSDAVVEFTRTLHGIQKSVTHRNQTQPVSAAGMKIGERRMTRKTDGGNSDNTIVTQVGTPAGNVARSERKTVFEDSSSLRRNVAANGILPERAAGEAGDGKTHSVDVQLHDDGTADVVTNDTAEKPVENATVEIRKTARTTVRSVTHRNQQEPLDGDDMAVGETRTSRMTDGGRYDNSTSVEDEDYKGNLAVSTSEDYATRTVSETKGGQEEPDATPESPAINRIVRKSGHYDEHGKWEQTTETTIHKPQTGSGAASSGGVSQTTSVTRTNAVDPGGDVFGEPNVVESVNSQPNAQGSFTVTRSKTVYHEKTSVSTVETPTEIAVTTKTINSLTASGFVSNGRLTIEPNDHGSFTVTKTEITPKQIDTGLIVWEARELTEDKIKWYQCGLRIFKNFKTPPIPTGYSKFDFQVTLNEYGLFDGCLSYKILVHWEYRGPY